MKPRPQTLHPVLRIFAAGCVVLWITGVALCDAEHLFESTDAERPAVGASVRNQAVVSSHDESHEHAGAHEHTHHADGAEGGGHHSHQHGHNHGEDDSCCSTIRATPQVCAPVVVYAPVAQVFAFLSDVLETRAAALLALDRHFGHPPPDREWLFTPAVYLGPAIRSQAPPASV